MSSSEGTELEKADAGLLAALFNQRQSATTVTAFQAFEADRQEEIDSIIKDHKGIPSIGECRSIKSVLFKALSPEEHECYKRDAEELTLENRLYFDQNVDDDVLFK